MGCCITYGISVAGEQADELLSKLKLTLSSFLTEERYGSTKLNHMKQQSKRLDLFACLQIFGL